MDLFQSTRSHFRFSRIVKRDVGEQSANLFDFRALILQKQHSYPRISRWLDKQVLSQLEHPARAAYVAHLDDQPVGAVVVKISDGLKLCHLRIVEDTRRQQLGDVFMGLVALHHGISSDRIYFTIPESVWEDQKYFFERFSFECHGQATKQYRLFDKELYCSASFSEYSRVALGRVGDLAHELNFGPIKEKPTLLLSMHPRFAYSILGGIKSIEVRRKFSRRWIGHRVAIYASNPEQAIVGEATIEMVDVAKPEDIWRRYAVDMDCDADEFVTYCEGASVISAIGLRDVVRFAEPIRRSSLVSMFGRAVRPPQSYFLLRHGDPWTEAISIASTLGVR